VEEEDDCSAVEELELSPVEDEDELASPVDVEEEEGSPVEDGPVDDELATHRSVNPVVGAELFSGRKPISSQKLRFTG
jgi:hypothetical protein